MVTHSFFGSVVGAWMVFTLLGVKQSFFFSISSCHHEFEFERLLRIVQTVPVAKIFGAFLFCFLAEIFGRKYTVITLFIPIIVSCALMEFSCESKNLIVAASARDISYGGAATILPVYLGEISEKQSRGRIISLLFTLQSIGPYLQAIFNIISPVVALSIVNYGSILLSILTGLVFAACTIDTPSYYIQLKQPELARESLRTIRNAHVDIDHEFDQLLGKKGDTENINGTVMRCLKSNGCLKAFIIMMSLFGFNILTGHCSLNLFKASPFNTNENFNYLNIWKGISICGSGLLCSVLVDKIGRLKCLLISLAIMFVDQFVIIILIANGTPINEYLVIIVILIFFSAYCIGVGPISLVLLGELFPMKFKMILSATVTSFFFALDFIATICVFYEVEVRIMLFVSFSCCFTAIFTVKFFYFETKGKSLNEIQLSLNKI